MQSKLQQSIMRRVYYSFAVSLVTSGAFVQGLVLGGAIALFGKLTHVAAIIHNTLSVPLGTVPTYLYNAVVGALAGGEVLTVLVTALIVVLGTMATMRLTRVAAALLTSRQVA